MSTSLLYFDQVQQAAEFVTHRIPTPIDVAVLTGTGLGDISAFLENPTVILYSDIPHFPTPTVESHHGRLLVGQLQNLTVAVFTGRVHLYEGYSPQKVTFGMRLLQALDVETVIVTNAAGGIGTHVKTGDILLITDHINLTGENPLVGPAPEGWGDRFPDMSAVYDKKLLAKAEELAIHLQLHYSKGVYCGLKGPSLETPAEVRFLRTIGASAVGLSTVLEVIVAVAARMHIVGFSAITNSHTPEAPQETSLDDVVTTAGTIAPHMTRLIQELLLYLASTKEPS